MAPSADAVAKAFRDLPSTVTNAKQSNALHRAVGALQDYNVEQEEELPQEVLDAIDAKLCEVVRSSLAKDAKEAFHDSIMFAMKALAFMGSKQATETIIDAIRRNYSADDYMWNVVLGIFGEHKHPQAELLFGEMKRELPRSTIAVSLLEAANAACVEHGLTAHPFDSEAGQEALLGLLQGKRITDDAEEADVDEDDDDDDENGDEDEFGEDEDAPGPHPPAITAIAFVSEKYRKPLLEAAEKLTGDPEIRLEYNWLRAKLGDPAGVQGMAETALDITMSWRAVGLMRELGLDAHIPAKALEPRFVAGAELAGWFAHPNEVGESPSRMVHVDSRRIWWPPTKDEREMHIFRAEYDPSGHREEAESFIGVVGSVTFSLLDDDLVNAAPEEIYGAHCLWELRVEKDPRAIEGAKPKKGWEMIQKRM